MNNTTRHNHTWAQLLARFAQAVGVPEQGQGPLSFSKPGSPLIVAELLNDGSALGLTVDLEHTPEGAMLEDFLIANQMGNAQDMGVYAVMPSRNNTLLYFRRLEDAGLYSFETMEKAIEDFSNTARAALDALPKPLQGGAHEPSQDEALAHAEAFRHVWADFAHNQGLGRNGPDPDGDGSYILLLNGERHVFVRPDTARGCVVLRTSMALLPLLNDDEDDVWKNLLEAHTLGQVTGGVVFSINPQEQELEAWRCLPLSDLDAYGLNDAIDSLAEVARFYKEEFRVDMLPA